MTKVLILGANSDIAEAIAKNYAKENAELILAGRNMGNINILKKDIEIRYGALCHTFFFDALDFESHKKFYQDLPVKPDIVVLAFGVMFDNEESFCDNEKSMNIINSNYTGAVSILNIIANEFCLRKYGTIVGISSVAGDRGRGSNFIYGSAKAGFTTYLSGLRNWCFPHKVHVLTVLPGYVYTKLTAHLNLPSFLTASTEQVAESINKGIKKSKNLIYIKWFWKYIMILIKIIPESFFKKLKL